MQQDESIGTYTYDCNFSDTSQGSKFNFLSNNYEKEINDYCIWENENPIFGDFFFLNEENAKKEKQPLFRTKGKRGRSIDSIRRKKRIHDRNIVDNILRKVQTHYMTFILLFLNDLLEEFSFNKKFLKLDYRFKKIIKKDLFESQKEKKIGDIVSQKLTNKYRYDSKDYNEKLCKEIKEKNMILSNILSIKYITLFKKVYFKSLKKFNLHIFEIDCDKEINLSNKVKMYKDLLEKDKNTEYVEKINNCVLKYFLPELIFKTEYSS